MKRLPSESTNNLSGPYKRNLPSQRRFLGVAQVLRREVVPGHEISLIWTLYHHLNSRSFLANEKIREVARRK